MKAQEQLNKTPLSSKMTPSKGITPNTPKTPKTGNKSTPVKVSLVINRYIVNEI